VEARDRCVLGLSGVGRTTVVLAMEVVADGGGGSEKLFKGVETSMVSCWLFLGGDEKERSPVVTAAVEGCGTGRSWLRSLSGLGLLMSYWSSLAAVDLSSSLLLSLSLPTVADDRVL